MWSKYVALFIKERSLYILYTAQAQIKQIHKEPKKGEGKKQVSNLRLKMTLAPVIGGSERQGLENILCVLEKKRTRYRGLQKVVHGGERPQIHYSAYFLDNISQ